MSGALTSAARWLFLATLVYAPWAYGCTRPWTVDLLNLLIATVVGLRLSACILERQLPRLPWLCVLSACMLCAHGWLMAINAHQLYDFEFHQFVPVQAKWPNSPGAIDGPIASQMMWRVSALLGALLFTIDLARESQWRRRLGWTILTAGSTVIAFGLAERILGAPMIFWESDRTAPTFFATYVYHGNAGSFINLVLPVVAVLTVKAFRQSDRYLSRAICVPALLVTIAGAFVNVSKAAMAVSVGLLIVIALGQISTLLQARSETRIGGVLLGSGFLFAAVAVLVLAGGWEKAWHRWSQLPQILQNNPRRIVADVAWQMTRDSGWWGFGPGTLEIIFPHYTSHLGQKIAGVWRFAHHDYLQTLVEWGWIGAALWAVIIFGGLILAAWHGTKRKGAVPSETRPLYFAAALALSGTALHSLVDFPFQIASLQLYIMVYAGLGWSALFRR